VKADGEQPSSDDDVDGNSDHQSPQKQLLDAEDLDTEIKPIILEYFHNGDTIEVITLIKKYSLPSRVRPLLVSYLVQLALENNNTSKELISRLLRDLTLEVIVAESDYVLGFDLLLKNLPDLTLDNPDAPEKTGTFIARAIADRVLGRAYLDRFQAENMPDLSNEKVQKALESARLLVTMNDRLFHLSHIWGNKGGFLAVQELTDKINEIIQEYHDSGDSNEAIRCLKELNVPHFHHEFVFEVIFYLSSNFHRLNSIIFIQLHLICF
jgi:programmed cell death protein 4